MRCSIGRSSRSWVAIRAISLRTTRSTRKGGFIERCSSEQDTTRRRCRISIRKLPHQLVDVVVDPLDGGADGLEPVRGNEANVAERVEEHVHGDPAVGEL